MDVELTEENVDSIVGLQGLNPSTLNVTRCQNPVYYTPKILIVHRKTHTDKRRDGNRSVPFASKQNKLLSFLKVFIVYYSEHQKLG